ncbi:Cyclin-dependent kinase 20 [Chamberlinius hualienensis]
MMDNYNIIGRVSEGAHGVVLKARNLQTGKIVAMKRVPLKNFENGIPNSALREIKTLRVIDSEHVVKLLDVFPHGSGFVLVFEYMVTDLAEVMRQATEKLKANEVKSYMQMLLRAVSYCHSTSIIHRDLKPANLLLSSNGILKVADFGLARVMVQEGERLYSHQVATRWYRSPELLFGARQYNEAVDLWAIGCIFGEMLNHSPLFPGENDIDQLCVVMRTLGTPSEDSWPGLATLPDYNKITFPEMKAIPIEDVVPDASQNAVDLLKDFLCYPPEKRISANDALLHPYFFTLPMPLSLKNLPKYQEKRNETELRIDIELHNYKLSQEDFPELNLITPFILQTRFTV